MIKVGLTGTRYSGKDKVCNFFSKISVPVFDADTVIKFILTYNTDIISKIKEEIGEEVLKDGFLSIEKLIEYKNFDQVLDIIEEELFFAYNRFSEKNKSLVYSIFNCSVLFEKKWNMYMDYNISVYAPFTERVERSKTQFGKNITKSNTILNKEVSELDKNKIADFVIHNYGKNEVFKQVHEIDQKIIDNYLIENR